MHVLRKKKLNIEPRFWPSVSSGSSNWRKEKQQRWEEGEARKSLLMVLNKADGLTAPAEVAMGRSCAAGLRGGRQSRTGAMDWALLELKPWEQKQLI